MVITAQEHPIPEKPQSQRFDGMLKKQNQKGEVSSMEYKCETSTHNRDVGDPVAVKFTDNSRFIGQHGGNTDGVSITTVNRKGDTLTHCSISVRDFLAIARALKKA